MTKTILKTGLTLALIISVFTGCSTHYNYAVPSVKNNNTYLIVARSERSAYGFTHLNYVNSTYAVLQQASNFAISKNKKYFTIIAPKTVSSLDGSLINTAKGFIEKCSANTGDVFVGGLDKCGIHGKSAGHEGIIQIKLFDEEQDKVLVYNAKNVIEYLKDNDMYDDKPLEVRHLAPKGKVLRL